MPDAALDPTEVLAADAAALGAELAPRVAALAATASSLVLERVAGWEPQLAQRGLTASRWREVGPLVRAAVLCARPTSEAVAADLLTDALSVVQFAASRRIPLQPQYVFRETTTAAYLTTITTGSRATVGSRLKTLTSGVTTALDTPVETLSANSPTTTATATAAGADGDAQPRPGEAEPLLMDRPCPQPRQLRAAGLNGPAAGEVLSALGAVRAQVLAVEPAALRREPRFRGRGRAIPYGDVEVISMLAAAATQRSAKRRTAVAATICVGVGAGVTGEAAANLKGGDVITLSPSGGSVPASPAAAGDSSAPLTVALRVGERTVPLHSAFAPPVLAAAEAAGASGWLLGGGPSRRNRISEIASGLANTDAHLVRLSSSRLAATWLAMNATRGVPLGDLLAAAGWTSATPLDQLLAYLPRATPAGQAKLAGVVLNATGAGDARQPVHQAPLRTGQGR